MTFTKLISKTTANLYFASELIEASLNNDNIKMKTKYN